MKRAVRQVVSSRDILMGDTKIGQPLPTNEIDQIDPFILLHHAALKTYAPGAEMMHVPPHPHRGFEPVTFVFSGEVEHRDSRGNHEVVKSGGVQWLTAGMGIIHSEGASPAFRESGGTMEIIQLWINLPGKFKMVQPNYQPFNREEIPFHEENGARVNVISGQWNGLTGPVNSLTGVLALTIEMEAGGSLNLEVPKDRNVLLYQLRGKSLVSGQQIGAQQLVEFEYGGTEVSIAAEESSVLLFLTGNPINEPMVQHGPYVMNTETEILQAMRDYGMGKMGFLPALAN